ncbi:MAG: antitoxin of toxin-antitoxin stability system [Nitrospiraceae bacterium]
MREVTVKLYTFDELDPKAKEKARGWYREGIESSEWADDVIEDSDTIAKILGIDLHRDGKTIPQIYWSGFSSQGDGACFVGRYSYSRQAHYRIRSHAPIDKELHRIADGLYALQRIGRFKLAMDITHTGWYYDSRSVSYEDISSFEIKNAHVIVMDEIFDLLRAFMDWIYRNLERSYEWAQANEQVDENIQANEYEFTVDGTRYTERRAS